MKVAVEPAPNSSVVLNIEIDQETVDRGLHRAYQRFANRLSIPGFRRGKAPRVVVERHVGRAALVQEAIDLLLPDLFQQAVTETGIRPVAQPRFDLVQMEPLTLKATVDVEPTVELGDYRTLRIERPAVVLSDSDVEALIEDFRRRHAEQVPVERPVQLGDVVVLDFRVTQGERTVATRREIEYTVDAEDKDPAPGFAAQLVGLRAGEHAEFDLTLPEDAEEAELAGQSVHFAVTLGEVKEVRLPPLDDSLARLHGEASTLVELSAHFAAQLAERREREEEERYARAVVAAAVEQARIELPESLMSEEVKRTVERYAARLSGQPLARQRFLQTMQQSGEEFRAQLRPEVEKATKAELVLDAIAAAESIEVSTEEITAEIEGFAQGDEQQDAKLADLGSNPRFRENVAQSLRRRKARELLVRIASGAQGAPDGADATPPAPEAPATVPRPRRRAKA